MDTDFVIAVSQREEVADLLETVLRQHLEDAGIAPVNDTYEMVMGQYAIGRFPSTPEMRFFLEDLRAFTPELANRLAKQVLSLFKKWTVVPQYHEKTFTVSAKSVSFGMSTVPIPITEETEAYQRWLRTARRWDEQLKGPLRRQFRHLVPLIPGAIDQLRKKKVVVLAAFDKFVPHIWEGNPVVWVLTVGGKNEPEMTPGGSQLTRTVTADGVVEPEYSRKYYPHTDLPAPYFLHAHEFPWESRNKLTVKLPGGGIARTRVLGTVRVDELIRDVDLKAQQRRRKRG